jgi:hypothetical protein
VTTTPRTARDAQEPLCSGEHHPGVKGEPLKLVCQLCPKSPTYWRLPETVRQEALPASTSPNRSAT